MIKRNNWEEFELEELEKWNTPKLLSHFEQIRAYRTNADKIQDLKLEELREVSWNLRLYDNYLSNLKHVLSTREHIPNKQEAKAIRQEKAKAKKNR